MSGGFGCQGHAIILGGAASAIKVLEIDKLELTRRGATNAIMRIAEPGALENRRASAGFKVCGTGSALQFPGMQSISRCFQYPIFLVLENLLKLFIGSLEYRFPLCIRVSSQQMTYAI
jgi:hypothetical protein